MSLRARLERHLNAIWYARDSTPPPLLYRGLAQVHQKLGQSRFSRPSCQPPVPLIVVGNLCAGGSGKTPTVMALVEAFKNDYRVAVISRGYGGRSDSYPVQVSNESRVEEVGDEALLIQRRSGVPVWIDPNRSRALEKALSVSGAELVISDDGLQHQQLARSFELCLIDGQRGLGNGRLLPAGPLRQPLDRLASVDQVLIKGDGMAWPGAQRFFLEPVGFRQPGHDCDPDLASWAGRSVTGVCGLANPGQFKGMLNALGIEVDLRAFPDHHLFRERDFHGLTGPLVTSAKDEVKFGPWVSKFDLHVLEVKADLPSSLIARIHQHIQEFP